MVGSGVLMNPIWSAVISILSISAISAMLLSVLKYIFLPHYRLEINRKKHKDDAAAVLKYYENVYKQNKESPKSKFELQKSTNAAFGTSQFNYELIFMLFDRDERDVEIRAKQIQSRWLLITVDYVNQKIKCCLSKKWINRLAVFSILLYFGLASIVLSMSIGYEWYGLRNFKEIYVILTLFLLILTVAYFLYVLGTLKSLERLIDR